MSGKGRVGDDISGKTGFFGGGCRLTSLFRQYGKCWFSVLCRDDSFCVHSVTVSAIIPITNGSALGLTRSCDGQGPLRAAKRPPAAP